MRRTKSTARCSHVVAAGSSSSEDNISLGANQEEAHAPSADVISSNAIHNAEATCLRSGMNSPASTRHSGRTVFQCKFVLVLVFFKL